MKKCKDQNQQGVVVSASAAEEEVLTTADVHSNSCTNLSFHSRVGNDYIPYRSPGLCDFQQTGNKDGPLSCLSSTLHLRVKVNTLNGLDISEISVTSRSKY